MNNYGKNLPEAIALMKENRIQVSNFTPKDLDLQQTDYTKETWKKIQEKEAVTPEGVKLDPSSPESKSESSSKFSSLSGKSPKEGNTNIGNKRRRVDIPSDPEATSIDDWPSFSEFIPDTLSRDGLTRLNGYQAGALYKLFKTKPGRKRVNIGGTTYTIVQYDEEKARPTEYNPKGLTLGLQVFVRGG
jgi:hypothetical protein